MASLHVLVIDDEPAGRRILASAVARAGYTVDLAATFLEATNKLAAGEIDVALCDIRLPDGSGIDLLRNCRALGIETAFIMVTAFASMESAIESLRAGATDYIVRPVRHEEVLHQLAQLAAMNGLRDENRLLRRAIGDRKELHVYRSDCMQRMDRMVSKIASADSTVLVTGESGTGKGVVARAIHDRSIRSEHAFVSVNCGAIPEQLLESELFGHVKGAFTGADRVRKGLFLEADRGTLFLDEIGELPTSMQIKLLHVIEDKSVRPLGSAQARHADTRVIVATNRNLTEMVRLGTFREDLYFRLKVLEIRLPPLRDRLEDLRGLIQFFVQRGGGTQQAATISPEAEEIMLRHPWPGNVRELENVLHRAILFADRNRIEVADLPADLVAAVENAACAEAPNLSLTTLRGRRRRAEGEMILAAIEQAGGDRRRAAQALGISLSTLYSKLSEIAKE